MHDILSNYKVGSLTMKVVEMELKKAEHRDEERKKRLEDGVRRGGEHNTHACVASPCMRTHTRLPTCYSKQGPI
jgi:hypothetical protein